MMLGILSRNTHKRTNWYHPLLWVHINATAQRYDWSPTAMVNALQREHPKLFSCLHKGTVSKWIDKSKRQWSSITLHNVENRHTLTGSGHSGILSQYPVIQDEIVEKLKSLRESGVPISVVVGQSIMLAVIQDRVPELLTKFKCSEVCPGAHNDLSSSANVDIEIRMNIL